MSESWWVEARDRTTFDARVAERQPVMRASRFGTPTADVNLIVEETPLMRHVRDREEVSHAMPVEAPIVVGMRFKPGKKHTGCDRFPRPFTVTAKIAKGETLVIEEEGGARRVVSATSVGACRGSGCVRVVAAENIVWPSTQIVVNSFLKAEPETRISRRSTMAQFKFKGMTKEGFASYNMVGVENASILVRRVFPATPPPTLDILADGMAEPSQAVIEATAKKEAARAASAERKIKAQASAADRLAKAEQLAVKAAERAAKLKAKMQKNLAPAEVAAL